MTSKQTDNQQDTAPGGDTQEASEALGDAVEAVGTGSGVDLGGTGSGVDHLRHGPAGPTRLDSSGKVQRRGRGARPG
jgi:hypothetical protein